MIHDRSCYLFAFIVFLGAFLLFWIQPLISFEITPLLGGTPSVWNTLLFLFQGLLLVGYLYAHLGTQYLSVRNFITLHIILIAISCMFLQPGLADSIQNPDLQNPYLWVLKKGVISVGLPFFLLASTAPIIQKLYVGATVENSNGPYWLYSASNFGSLLALLLFPIIIQPLATLHHQYFLWSAIYLFFTFLIFIYLTFIFFRKPLIQKTQIFEKSSKNWKQRARWVILAFIPSSLLHGVTLVITNDISSFPLLWIMPLSIYLITFIVAFSGWRKAPLSIFDRIIVFTVLLPALVLPLWIYQSESLLILTSHLLLFFVLALYCHQILYKERPHRDYLTEFYFWLALGGVLGGLFNAIIAPIVFEKIWEYPLSICIAVYIILRSCSSEYFIKSKRLYFTLSFLGAVIMCGGMLYGLVHKQYFIDSIGQTPALIGLSLCGALALLFAFQNRGLLIFVIIALFSLSGWNSAVNLYGLDIKNIFHKNTTLLLERNYFGIIKVIDSSTFNGFDTHSFYNGTLVHSSEAYDHQNKRVIIDPETYHHAIVENARKLGKPYASFGLGSGEDNCYTQPGEQIDFYEINPSVIKMAKNQDLFKALSTCNDNYRIFEGDVRQKLKNIPDEYYGGIISTVSTSASVPFHLITKEAIELYLSKLAPGGALVFMTPGNYFNFTSLFARYSSVFNIPVRVLYTENNLDGSSFRYFLFLKPPLNYSADFENSLVFWQHVEPEHAGFLWTDSHINILKVLK
jgi:hypothetical protein